MAFKRRRVTYKVGSRHHFEFILSEKIKPQCDRPWFLMLFRREISIQRQNMRRYVFLMYREQNKTHCLGPMVRIQFQLFHRGERKIITRRPFWQARLHSAVGFSGIKFNKKCADFVNPLLEQNYWKRIYTMILLSNIPKLCWHSLKNSKLQLFFATPNKIV